MIFKFLPIIIVVVISSLVERTYEYFDPLITVLIFTYFKFNKKVFQIDRNIIFLYFIYLIMFLAFANIYYNYFDLNALK